MVSISDEVPLAYLEKFHGRQRNLLVVGLVNAEPARSSSGLAGKKRSIKVSVTSLAAYDLVQGNGLQAPIMLPCERQALANLVE
jgi:hypothetical protein